MRFATVALLVVCFGAMIHEVLALTIGIDGSNPPSSDSWDIKSYSTLSVAAGTVISFQWSGTHTVMVKDATGCSGGTAVPTSGTSATFDTTGMAPGSSKFFHCSISDHCSLGMLVQVQITSGTMAPSVHSPTVAPNAATSSPSVSATCPGNKTKPACVAAKCMWNAKTKKCAKKPKKG